MEQVNSYRYLGVWLISTLSWSQQVAVCVTLQGRKIVSFIEILLMLTQPQKWQLYNTCI